ncbi:uracil-xanthine permease family protein [Marinobacterium mangrovicola]|uniref:Uracil permease n=1 Tax=Marinobacterium mangrovicola TaxID=1476959 RepID=A0A4R1G950_9GAMM|nr:uracil-xanthine permease family protein [Marinobacterium mangrovicola]TCK03120.1 uracil permease [Marinobacterium mangrovicola]
MVESNTQSLGNFNWKMILAGAQMLFVAFGALVLMPLLTGLDPNVALFTAGVGTLLFHLVTGLSVPIFLASSFVFIAPIAYSIQTWGVPATMGALMGAGVVYMLLALLVKLKGAGIIHRIMPPVVTGPVIMIIGLGLAPMAVNMAMGKTGDGSMELFPYVDSIIVSMTALLTTLLVSVFAHGIFRLLPILSGVFVGYLAAWAMGMVDWSVINETPVVSVPAFVLPEFNWQALLFMIPVAIAPAIEHVGDIIAIGNVTGKDYIRKPGLQRTLFGDGLATSAAAIFGGPPNTTYSEVTGAVMLTRSFNPVVMLWAAGFAIMLAFVAKFGALLQTIPVPVMGGIMILLFGSIASVGLNTLIKAHVDLGKQRNLVIVATVLVFGIGGMALGNGDLNLQGVSLCGIVAIILNLVLPGADPLPGDLHAEEEVVDDIVEHSR